MFRIFWRFKRFIWDNYFTHKSVSRKKEIHLEEDIFLFIEGFPSKSPLIFYLKKENILYVCKKKVFSDYNSIRISIFRLKTISKSVLLFTLTLRLRKLSTSKVLVDIYGPSNLKIQPNVCEEDEKTVVAATFLRATLRPFGGDQENRG